MKRLLLAVPLLLCACDTIGPVSSVKICRDDTNGKISYVGVVRDSSTCKTVEQIDDAIADAENLVVQLKRAREQLAA